jgi:predicted transcriptional regulator
MAKVPFTVRVLPAHLEGLQRLAAEKDRTMSMLVATAIEEYLIRQTGGIVNETEDIANGAQSNSQVFLSADDLTRVIPILAHFDKLPLDLILQLVCAKRSDPV